MTPRTATEKLVARVWSELLGVSPVGALDDFFELGGRSLLATQVAARLSAELGVQLPMLLLFEGPVLEEMAANIDELLVAGESLRLLLGDIDGISDTDVARLLRDMGEEG